MPAYRPTRRQLLAHGALLSAISGTNIFTRNAAAADKKVAIRFDYDINILDPGYMVGGTEVDVQKAVLPILVDFDVKDGVVGWKPSDYVTKFEQRDATHIDFELKPGFMWSGGFGEFTAEDVKYSYERMKTSDWKGNFESLDYVEVTGTHSGTLVLSQPFAPFIQVGLAGSTGAILSKAAMATVGDKYTSDIPATCGPYTYEWTPKQRVRFTRNPDWKGPPPAYDEIDALVIEEDAAAELAFEAGEVAMTPITPATVVRYGQALPPDSTLTVAGSLNYTWLGMNTENPKLADIKVRQAIQHAVDANQIIAGAFSGATEKSNGIVCPGLIGHRKATKYSFDPEKAKALLAEAGVSGLELELKALNEQATLLAAQIIQAQLLAIGVTVKVTPLDSGPFWEMGDQSKGDGYKTMEIWLMRFTTQSDPQEATQWFTGAQVGVWNWERWKSDEYDKLYQDGMTETDSAKRTEIYLRMQEIMEDTGAYVWIQHEPETFVHRSDLSISVSPAAQMKLREFKPA